MAGPRDTPNVPTMKPDGTHQDTVVLNDFGGVELSQRARTSAAGKTSVRYTLDIDADPILHNLRGLDLGKKPAEAILALITRQHKAIGQFAKPSTIRRRETWARQYAKGDPRALRRYAGGKTGPTPPHQTDRLGIDSGRMAGGYFVRANPAEGNYTINVPANRLDPETFGGGLAALQRWVERLVQLVPALTGKGIVEDDAFVRAVAESPVVSVLKGNYAAKVASIYGKAVWSGARQFARFI